MTRQPKRPGAMARISLADLIKARSIEAARAAMAEGGERIAYRISEKINSALNEPQVLIRIKAASPQERGDAVEQLIQIGNALAANDALPPNPERLVFAADRAGFGMDTTPGILLALLTEASAAVTNAADDALAESAGDADPPTQNDLAAWFGAGKCPPKVLAEVAKRLAVLWDTEPDKVRITGWAFGGLVTWRDGVEFHAPAGELLATAKKRNMPNPLYPLVQAYPVVTEPGRHDRPIVPAVFVQTQQQPLFHLPAPELPGHTTLGDTAYLPGLEPEAPPAPALLLAMFDAAGGASLTQNGRVSAAASIWLEAMLDLPPASRDGSLRETRYPIREVAGEWLGWNLRNYRTTGKKTGQALAHALRDVRDLWVPMNDRGGGYFPVMVSAWSGWSLDDRLGFVVRLPRGHVGPQIDRRLLRSLRDSGPAYRLYLSLCFEWDKYGGHNGKLIRPTRPEVRRGSGGQVLDAKGQILTGRGNQPIYTPHDKRAILTGEREPNPARSRYPEYSPDDLVAMAFPGQVFADKHTRREIRRRAVAALHRLETAGVVVEWMGTTLHPTFRPMPPDPAALPRGLPATRGLPALDG